MIGSIKTIAAGLLSAAVLVSGFSTASAMPIAARPTVESSGAIEQVQWRDGYYRGHRGFYRGGGGYYRGGGYYGRSGWYNGHRGYRSYRPGYRHYNGYWFPLAAFGAGALIGGALAAPAPRYYAPAPRYARPAAGINPQHVSWCEQRYRSYRAYDNSFQPYNGPRQQCYSPYF